MLSNPLHLIHGLPWRLVIPLSVASAGAVAYWAESIYAVALANRWRSPRLRARSGHCRHCGYRIRALDQVPLFSWLLLRGRCRSCHRRIPRIYLLFALLGALTGAAAGLSLVVAPVVYVLALPAQLVAFWLLANGLIFLEPARIAHWAVCWPERKSGGGAGLQAWRLHRGRAELWRVAGSYWLEYRVPGTQVRRWGPYPSRASALLALREEILPRPLRRTYRALCVVDFLADDAKRELRQSFARPLPHTFLTAFLRLAEPSRMKDAADALPPALMTSLQMLRNTTKAVLTEAREGADKKRTPAEETEDGHEAVAHGNPAV